MKRLSLALLIFVVLSPANPSVAQNEFGYCNDGSTPQQQCDAVLASAISQYNSRIRVCSDLSHSGRDPFGECWDQAESDRNNARSYHNQCRFLNECVLDLD